MADPKKSEYLKTWKKANDYHRNGYRNGNFKEYEKGWLRIFGGKRKQTNLI